MSTFRKVARDMARSQSKKQSHTTDMFQYYFDKIWREKYKHEASHISNPTKKKRRRAK